MALQRARDRLGQRSALVQWVTADVTAADLGDQFDVWHDRAVFHFLTAPDDRERYVAQLRSSLAKDGDAVIATFGLEGPTHCSGLPIQRYSPDGLQRALGDGFILTHSELAIQTTPTGNEQQFVYASFRRL